MKPLAFPKDTRFTPVPDPILGPLLDSIDDLGELKCILRALWHLHHRKGPLRYVTSRELASDPILERELGNLYASPAEAIDQRMAKATQRGIFISQRVSHDDESILYVLNTETDRRALESAQRRGLDVAENLREANSVREMPETKPNIFTIYEENIGIITPLIAEELKDAEGEYPWDWIKEAFKIAVSRNRRNWRYVSRILERWATEGKEDGEFGEHTEKVDRKRYLKEYLQRGRRLPGT